MGSRLPSLKGSGWSVFGGKLCHEGGRSPVSVCLFCSWLGKGQWEMEKWWEPKRFLRCSLGGRLWASGISESFWAKYGRFSFPRARDLFTWCWEQVQVSALPWQIRRLPKEEDYIKIRRQLESWKWTIAESKRAGFPGRSTVGEQLACSGRRGRR